MQITEVHIKGFRSLIDVSVRLAEYTTLIGRNDCGKSSFLRALQLLFDPDSVAKEIDRCSLQGLDAECFVEARIEQCPDGCSFATGGIAVVRRLLFARPAGWEYRGQVPKSALLKGMQAGKVTKTAISSCTDLSADLKARILKELPAGTVPAEVARELFETLSAEGQVEREEGWCALDQALLKKAVEPVFLEADAKAEDEVADGDRAAFGRLGGILVREATARYPQLTEALATLNEVIGQITSRNDEGQWQLGELNVLQALLSEEVAEFDGSVQVRTDIVAPRAPSLSFGVRLDVSDDCSSGLSQMGHGLRRTLIFSMLRALRKLHTALRMEDDAATNPVAPEKLYLFLVEEPELYLHPQAERRRMRELRQLGAQDNAQVVLCTHSAFFVDLNEYHGILRFERPNRKGAVVHRWTGEDLPQPDKKTLNTTVFFDPTRAAMLFADRVILVEGQSEKVTIPCLADKLGIDTTAIELVECGGNGSMPIYQRVLQELKVPYVAWLDSDRRTEITATKAVMDEALGRLVVTEVNWEHMAKLSKGGDKVYNSWKKYVFDGEDPPDAVAVRIRAAYNWQSHTERLNTKADKVKEA